MEGIDRRGALALAATGLALGLARKVAYADTKTPNRLTALSPVAQQCIDSCSKCHNVCVASVQHCLNVGGDHVKPEHLRLLENCADICALAADFMLRDSEFSKKGCTLCEEVCRRCAESCDRFPDDADMKRCATVCRECADACKRFVQS